MLPYRFLADAVVFLHATYIGFVVLGMVAILLGAMLRWGWVRNFWFRLAHLVAIVVVAVEALLKIVCPLTTWENRLRGAAGETVHEGSFIGYWSHELIFFDAPDWVFTVAYCLFAVAVTVTFVLIPPRWPRRGRAKPNRT